jgi:hypothetical protein
MDCLIGGENSRNGRPIADHAHMGRLPVGLLPSIEGAGMLCIGNGTQHQTHGDAYPSDSPSHWLLTSIFSYCHEAWIIPIQLAG